MTSNPSAVQQPDLCELYQKMSLIRAVEIQIARIYPHDTIKSPIHLSIGQEAPVVGACQALAKTDTVFGTYRSHALYIAKGGNLNAMMAELFGKRTGCGKGKAGSMHLATPEANMIGTSAIVATSIPQAVGFALAEKMKNSNHLTAVFFGDGAMEEGVFHESMNFAALHELPMLFICENNGLAIYTPLETRVANTNFCARAESYGMPTQHIANNDSIKTWETVSKLATRMRQTGKGPCFIEIETQRWFGHVGPDEDWQYHYRDPALREQWLANDEIKRIANMLDIEDKQRIDNANAKAIGDAVHFAEQSPYPGEDDLLRDVYAT